MLFKGSQVKQIFVEKGGINTLIFKQGIKGSEQRSSLGGIEVLVEDQI